MTPDATLDRLRARLDALAAAPVARRGRRGMTLMEIMIVIAIILLLMGALTFGLAGLFGQAQSDTAALQITRIKERVEIYRIKKKKLPGSMEDVYKGEEQPKDPWGNDFVFKSGGKGGYDIISFGADGKDGGTGADADIKLSEM
jgi:general secretion pathway protein G